MLPEPAAVSKSWRPCDLILIRLSFLSLPLFLLLLVLSPRTWGCTCDPNVSFTAQAEWDGSPISATNPINVNVGNSLAAFVEAAYWEVYGVSPSAGTVAAQIANFANPWWRRVDTVNTYINGLTHASCLAVSKSYSDPWQSEPAFTTAPCKNIGRDVGAVCMFFFSCPGGVNCEMDWANTHALGMATPANLLMDSGSNGYYISSSNEGFWYLELMDARYAGLQFLMPNVYGPDITDGSVTNLSNALGQIAGLGISSQVKIGMFDDTSGWGSGPPPYNTIPPMAANPASAASMISSKWIAFMNQVQPYWYTVGGTGRPLIYFYNGGTLGSTNAGTVITQAKADFYAAEGVTPYVVVDDFFFADPNMSNPGAADNEFIWNPLPTASGGHAAGSIPGLVQVNGPNYYAYSHYTFNGITIDHAITKWDPVGRNNLGTKCNYVIANGGDGIIKGDNYLVGDLAQTLGDNILTIGTWNDLGEGTGINRNYDYYVNGTWEPPNFFMDDIRASQQQSSCVGTPIPTAAPTSTPAPAPNVLQTAFAPNPSRDPNFATVAYDLDSGADSVTIDVFAESTVKVRHFTDTIKVPGWNSSLLNISGISSGIYFVRVQAKAQGHLGRSAITEWALLP